jgi:protein involved in polysaccharide export with SLBB domain
MVIGIRSLSGLLAVCLLVPVTARAQDPRTTIMDSVRAALASGNMSPAAIASALQRSGLSLTDLRSRLRSAGFDTTLADAYFRGDTIAVPTSGGVPAGLLPGLRSAGILEPVPDTMAFPQPLRPPPDSSFDTLRLRPSDVFGSTVFRSGASRFDPSLAGPVDPSYRLGVGDVVQLVFTGGAEHAYTIAIRRDGTVLVPLVGQVPIAGLTLDAARTVLTRAAARSYSGVSTGRITVDLTVTRIRMQLVYVVGEVFRPGAVQVNALATAFHALARAGGPTDKGSFREITVRRAGQVVASIDLYHYLTAGDATQDIRLEQGDVIFVPLAERQVRLAGRVRRPGVFELRAGETLGDALRFAGGLEADAARDRIQVDRIVPPAERQPGRDRIVMDIAVPDTGTSAEPLRDGDVVEVFPVGTLRRNYVHLDGQVTRPGPYEWRPGLTLGALIERAQGLEPWGLADRIKIRRIERQLGRSEAFSIDFTQPDAARFALAEFDSVTVLDARVANPAFRVAVGGAVFRPGETAFAENLTLRDAIDLAGGLLPEAGGVEVVRRRVGAAYNDTTSTVREFSVRDGRLDPAGAAFTLDRYDRIFVRYQEGFRAQGFFQVTGMFARPGSYSVPHRGYRISDAIRDAGGTIPGAHQPSLRLMRGGRIVSNRMDRVLNDGTGNEYDLELQDGDVLAIGPNPGTVYVTGEVERPALVIHREGAGAGHYLESVGGAKRGGDRGRLLVEDPSGRVERSHKQLLFFRDDPEIRSGAVITVPPKPAGSRLIRDILSFGLQSATALASLVLTWRAID